MSEPYFILEVEIPQDVASFVMEQVKKGGYAGPDEYILALILAHREMGRD